MKRRRYRIPLALGYEVGRDLIQGKRRSLMLDSTRLIQSLTPPVQVSGHEHIPPVGLLLVTANHWQRPGLWIGWAGALIGDALSRKRGSDSPIHWLVVDAWRTGYGTDRPFEVPGTRWIFRRVAHMYGMTTMGGPRESRLGQARALRAWSRGIEGSSVALGLFPEGETGANGPPGPALPGVAHLISHVARRQVPVLPVAVWEEGATLRGRFGPLWYPPPDDRGEHGALDVEVMQRINVLLPEHLRRSPGSPMQPFGGRGDT